MFVLFLSTTLKHHEVHASNRKTTITHNDFRHCRMSFSPIVRQPFSKQLYSDFTGFWLFWSLRRGGPSREVVISRGSTVAACKETHVQFSSLCQWFFSQTTGICTLPAQQTSGIFWENLKLHVINPATKTFLKVRKNDFWAFPS